MRRSPSRWRDSILQETFDRATNEGKKPYLVPNGGSNATGALGYAFDMKELIDRDVSADWIVFASSSGGTQAGLLLGQRIFGFSGGHTGGQPALFAEQYADEFK